MAAEEDTRTAEGRGDDTRLAASTGEPPKHLGNRESRNTSDDLERRSGHNVLLQLGAELLALIAMMPRLQQPEDPARLREQVQDRLVRLRSEGGFLACHPWALEKCGMVFSAAVDETVLKTEWGRMSDWANDTLLSRIYGVRNGGELFFELLDQARMQPEVLAPFLELQYVLLQLGFTGRYHGQPEMRQSLCYELFSLLQRVAPSHPLECRPMPVIKDRPPLPLFRFGRLSLWASVGLVLMFIVSCYRNDQTAHDQSSHFQMILERRFAPPLFRSGPPPKSPSGEGL